MEVVLLTILYSKKTHWASMRAAVAYREEGMAVHPRILVFQIFPQFIVIHRN